jgi:hypothetical protein
MYIAIIYYRNRNRIIVMGFRIVNSTQRGNILEIIIRELV